MSAISLEQYLYVATWFRKPCAKLGSWPSESYCKIGITKNPRERIKALIDPMSLNGKNESLGYFGIYDASGIAYDIEQQLLNKFERWGESFKSEWVRHGADYMCKYIVNNFHVQIVTDRKLYDRKCNSWAYQKHINKLNNKSK